MNLSSRKENKAVSPQYSAKLRNLFLILYVLRFFSMIKIKDFSFNYFEARCCIVWDESGKCALVDPGCSTEEEYGKVTSFIASKELEPVCILLTHGHFDHVLGVAALSEKYGNIPVYMHPADKSALESNDYFCRMFDTPRPSHFTTTDTPEKIEVGSLTLEVIETPGHTTGGVCYLERKEKILFSGDTLFAGSIGRSDFPGGDYDTLMKSIFEKLMTLDGDITIIPGHGPTSSIADERMTNPFLMPFNEPYVE